RVPHAARGPPEGGGPPLPPRCFDDPAPVPPPPPSNGRRPDTALRRHSLAARNIPAPTERNPKLARFLEAANQNMALKARWHVQQVTAERMDMNDHSWVHLQIVLNRALHLFRLLHRAGLQSSVEKDYSMSNKDAEVV